ncbi:MAG: hypothetical protein LAT64_04185 [Phycisphaerales bacterium]|nr:hypothetical protein [Phycisphaerales bacterium]
MEQKRVALARDEELLHEFILQQRVPEQGQTLVCREGDEASVVRVIVAFHGNAGLFMQKAAPSAWHPF